MAREEVARLAHAGVGLEGQATQQRQDVRAAATPCLEPDDVADERSDERQRKAGEWMQQLGAHERSGGQKQGGAGKRKTYLVQQDEDEQHAGAVGRDEGRPVHGSLPQSGASLHTGT
jgi:hypothetical protein